MIASLSVSILMCINAILAPGKSGEIERVKFHCIYMMGFPYVSFEALSRLRSINLVRLFAEASWIRGKSPKILQRYFCWEILVDNIVWRGVRSSLEILAIKGSSEVLLTIINGLLLID